MVTSARSRTWLAGLALVAAGLLVYAQTFQAGFVFDDHELIENGRLLRGPLSAIWFGATATDYWPMTWTVLWGAWRLFGAEPFGYHVLNVALHLAAALLLWRALSRLGVAGAWLAGLLFAVHPVAVASVAWISELKNTLSAVLWLGTVLAWLRFEERRSWGRWSGALLLFGLALLSKVAVVVLPLVLLSVSWLRRGKLDRQLGLAVAPWFGLAAVAGAANVWFQRQNAMAGGWAPPRGVSERVGGAAWALGSYLLDCFLPLRLALVQAPWPVGPGVILFWLPLLGLLVTLLVAWRYWSGPARPLWLALGYHAICVAPVVGLVDMAFFRLAPVSDHLQYLALMGPVALLAWLVARLQLRARRLAVVVGTGLVAAFGFITFGRAAAFHDDFTLWRAAARDAPSSAVARREYGEQLIGAGQTTAGAIELEQAIALSPDASEKHALRSELHSIAGRTEEAAQEARLTLAGTEDPRLQSDAAWTLLGAGQTAEAIAALRRLTVRMPGSSEYAYRLSVALARGGQPSEAADVLLAYCRLRPGHPRMEASLALLLVRTGRVGEATAHAAEVLGIGADDPRAAAQVKRWYSDATGQAP